MSEESEVNKIRLLIGLTDAEISDCVSNAALGLEKLRKIGMSGRIIYVNSKNHAYLVPNGFPTNEIAVNPKTRVNLGSETVFVKYDDYTIRELLEMIKNGEADDIT